MEKEQKQGNNEATLTLDINAGPTFVMAQQNSVQCPISSTELSHKKVLLLLIVRIVVVKLKLAYTIQCTCFYG